MSTTVTYKGQTLTTVENQTKTLNTAGTWVEGDFTLTDASLDVSDTTATASDVAQGKVFYSNTGTRTTGTASGGGDEQYFLDLIAMRPTVIDDDKVTSMGDAFLYQHRTATGLRWRELLSTVGQTFRGINKATYIIFDKLLKTTADMISYSPLLTTAEFGAVTEIAYYTFENDPKFDTLILRTPTLVKLASQRVFDNTCFKNGGTGGTIYVPQALLSSYPTATNWSIVHGWGTITWTAIEGSYYETHHADGTEVSA